MLNPFQKRVPFKPPVSSGNLRPYTPAHDSLTCAEFQEFGQGPTDYARHVIIRILNPRFLSYVQPDDVASMIRLTLADGAPAAGRAGGRVTLSCPLSCIILLNHTD